MNSVSNFGDNIKYTLTLTAFALLAIAVPSVRDALASSIVGGSTSNTASAIVAVNTTVPNKPAQLNKCPNGRTCSQNSNAIPGVTARTQQGSKLALTYDSNKKEALLTATFKLTVNGGKNGVYLYTYPMISFRDSTGQAWYVNGQRNLPLVPSTKMASTTDVYGQVTYRVAPNHTEYFTAVGTVDPKTLFAGTYYATVDGLLGYQTATSSVLSIINVNSDNTNTKTIVGEIAPYITSISPAQINPGDKITINGQRLSGVSNIYIDGIGFKADAGYLVSNTAIEYTLSSSVSTGWHTLQVSDSNGMSNGVGFNILAPISTSTCYTFTTNMTVGSTGSDVSTLQNFLVKNGFLSKVYATGYFGAETKAAVVSYQTSVGLPGDGFVGPLTIAKLNASCVGGGTVPVTGASVTINGTPTLVLAYDSTQAESALVAKFNVTVKAGNSDLYLYTGMAGAGILDVNGQNTPATISVGVAAGEKSNQYGNYTVVSAGYSVAMTITVTSNPKIMFAGSYHGFLSNLYTFTANSIDPVKLMVPSNTTNEQVIIGETSPYINSINVTGNNGAVTGVRFNNNPMSTNAAKILIDGTNYGVSFGVPSTGTTISFTVPSLSVGYHSFQYINDRGASNIVGFQVQSTSTQQATIKVLSPNGGETYSVGSTVNISWKTSISTQSTQTVNLWLSDKYGNTIQAIASPLTNLGPLSNTGSYSWSIPQNLVSVGTTGAYKIFINSSDSSGNVFSDFSDSYFNITSATQVGQSPVISGGTFPTTLGVGQTGTWTVNASDPLNGSLSYSVNWGDAYSCPAGYTCVATTPNVIAQQTSTFTHSYANAGTYKVAFTVTNSSGLSAQTTATVQVTGSIVATTTAMTVTASLDASSPASSIIALSTSASITQNVPLAVYDLKVQGGNSVLKTIQIKLNIAGIDISTPLSTLFSSIYIKVGSQIYQGSNVGSRIVSFDNLAVSLPVDATVPIVVFANINSSLTNSWDGSSLWNGVSINSILNANGTSSLQVVDSNNNLVMPTGGQIYGNTITFSTTSVTPVTTPAVTTTSTKTVQVVVPTTVAPVKTTASIPATATKTCPTGYNMVLSQCFSTKKIGTKIAPTTTYTCPTNYVLNSSDNTCLSIVGMMDSSFDESNGPAGLDQPEFTASIWDSMRFFLGL